MGESALAAPARRRRYRAARAAGSLRAVDSVSRYYIERGGGGNSNPNPLYQALGGTADRARALLPLADGTALEEFAHTHTKVHRFGLSPEPSLASACTLSRQSNTDVSGHRIL